MSGTSDLSATARKTLVAILKCGSLVKGAVGWRCGSKIVSATIVTELIADHYLRLGRLSKFHPQRAYLTDAGKGRARRERAAILADEADELSAGIGAQP